MHEFLHRLRPTDRVLLVGDVRQHQAVDAGRPYQQLQEAGMATARLEDIVRQKDPALKAVVEQLSRGEVGPAIQALNAQGRIHEIADREDRLAAIAREYLKTAGRHAGRVAGQSIPDGDQPDDPSRDAARGPRGPRRARGARAGRAAGHHRCGPAVGRALRPRRRRALQQGQQDRRPRSGRVRARGTRERQAESRHGPPR